VAERVPKHSLKQCLKLTLNGKGKGMER
jgi:hypothetical protein